MNNMFFNATSFNQNLGAWYPEKLTTATNFFSNSTPISRQNYDALLNGWANKTPLSTATFGAANKQYCFGEDSRKTLSREWAISDGGNANCVTITPPVVTITTANRTAYPVVGTCQAGEGDVTITIGTVTRTVGCTAGTFNAELNLSDIPDSNTIPIDAFQTNSDGFKATATSVTTSKDTTPPTVAINNPAAINASTNQSAYSIAGTCTVGDGDVTITIGGAPLITKTVSCDSTGRFETTVDVSNFTDGTLTIKASQTDATGNVGNAEEKTVSIDTTLPTAMITDQIARKNRDYSFQIPTQHNNETLKVERVSGLPDGLEYADGKITGKPTKSGVWTVSVTYSDLAGNETTVTFSLGVRAVTTETTVISTPATVEEKPVSPSDDKNPIVIPETTPSSPVVEEPSAEKSDSDAVKYADSEIYNPTITNGQCYTRRPYL